MSYIKVPGDIEKRSFEIIEEELGDKVKKFSESELLIVKRIVHTSADFEYADLIEFQNNAIESGLKALEKGCKIYCDTNMIVNGLSKPALSKYNCSAYCLVSDKEVIEEVIGHQKIDTTLQYAMVSQNNVKISHRKYIG